MPREVRPDRAIQALERRAAFLYALEQDGQANSFHRQERNALTWALPILREIAHTAQQGREKI